jgi:hypothetical protein
MASVSGEEAARFDAVRRDSLTNVNKGDLVSADDVTGIVEWRDKTGEVKSATLGDHAIAIVPRSQYG